MVPGMLFHIPLQRFYPVVGGTYAVFRLGGLPYCTDESGSESHDSLVLGVRNYYSQRHNSNTPQHSRPPLTHLQSQGRQRPKLPLLGGTLTISITESPRRLSGSGSGRAPRARVLTKLQHIAKFGDAKPSDEVEGLNFQVHWDAIKGALGISIPPEAYALSIDDLKIVCALF